jgi:hypothetical protein
MKYNIISPNGFFTETGKEFIGNIMREINSTLNSEHIKNMSSNEFLTFASALKCQISDAISKK